MPGDLRHRAWKTVPRPYRVLDRRSGTPGEVRLVLAPATSVAASEKAVPGTTLNTVGAGARLGRYWILHTEQGLRLPVVQAGAAAPVLEVSTLRVPCGPLRIGVGDRVGMRGPLGTGWDLEGMAGRDLLLIAWESGLMPLRPLIEHAIAANRAANPAAGGNGDPPYGRIRVWAGGRTWQAIPYREEWNRWARRAGVTVSAGPDLTMRTAAREVAFTPATTWVVLAGPMPMARATADALVARGLAGARVELAAHHLIRCGERRCGRCRIPSPHGVLRACDDGPVIGHGRLAATNDPRWR